MQKIFTILCVVAICHFSNAQSGTEFWLAPPEVTLDHNPPGDEPIYVNLTSFSSPATVTISQPANPGFNGGSPIVINLLANDSHREILTAHKADLETAPTNTVLNTGLLIESTATISAYYEISNTNNPDILSLKGPNGVGEEFYIPLHQHAPFWNHNTFGNIAYTSFDIVATEDATTVMIYSPVALDGHPALTPFSITLNRGQTYSAGWTGANYWDPANNPAGAVVIADKPVAVSMKDDSVHNPSGGCYDLMADQLVPVDIMSTEYVAIKGFLNNTGDESAFVMATQNNTKVYLDGSPTEVATLFAGDYYRVDMDYLDASPDNAVHIRTTKPAYVNHVTGFGCESGMALLPPLTCAGSAQVSFVRSTSENFYLNIMVRSGSENDFTITGPGTASIDPLNFLVVPGTSGEWLAGQFQFNTTEIPVDQAHLISNSSDVFALGIINGGATSGTRYGYFSEFVGVVDIDAGLDQTICENTSATLAGTVEGGASTGIWTTSGSGAFVPSDTDLNATYVPSAADYASGTVTLTLTSTGSCDPVDDTMDITFQPEPTVDAGVDADVCSNNADISLSGTVIGALGGTWSGGAGTYTPSATDLNAVYTPTAAEILSGSITLTLTSTGNGLCSAQNDDVTYTFTPSPTINAGVDQTLCENNADVNLSATVTVATGGFWTGGAGTYNPSSTSLNAIYTPTAAEIASGNITLTITTSGNGNCVAVSDDIDIDFSDAPTADAGTDGTYCKNNADIILSGAITIATGGAWSGGLGTFTPSNLALGATYTPSATELSNGFVTLTLTTTGNGNCAAESDDVTFTFTDAPTADAGVNQTLCANNADATLSGSVTFATGGTWTGGAGTFTPDANTLNAVYTPTAGEISSGTVTLTLTTTGNGTCNAVSDDMTITYTAAPIVNAGSDQSVCENNPDVNLSGSVTIATGGSWTGGLGTFTPDANTLNAVYTPTAAEIVSGTLTLTLTSTGNGICNAESDVMTITFTDAPTADAGLDQTLCANNADISLSGTITNATGGQWTGGSGTFTPDATTLNATYTPSASEISAGTLTLTLNTTGNGNCIAVTDDVDFTFTPAPTVDAGIDQSLCENNADATLAGIVTIATGGTWSGGLGTFTPDANTLNAVYTPTAAELVAGTVTLTLTTTGNGSCNAESDDVVLTYTPEPTANAGIDQTKCSNNADVTLAGSITVATGGTWSGGAGTFTPNANTLNAIYTPTAAELAAETLTLTLTTTGNGTCNAESDDVTITFTDSPTANAGLDDTLCANNSDITLTGLVTVASGGQWTGGAGTYSPDANTLTAIYTPSAAELSAGTVTLTLTTTGNGNCIAASDNVTFTFTPAPTADAGIDQSLCENNADVTLAGLVTVATGGTWTGGTGTYAPDANDLNAVYTPSALELAAGTVTLTLTTTGNGSCNADSDDVTITFTAAPTASAGIDQSRCSNNADATLAGSVAGATGGTWSGGSGTYSPDPNTLNATYTPSAAELAAGTVTLTLTTTGNGTCNAESDDVTLTFTDSPTADAGSDAIRCENNAEVILAGAVTVATGGQWTGGAGSYTPDANTLIATYNPSAAELAAGSVTLTLTTTGNGSCIAVSNDVVLTFTDAPSADAGINQSLCENNGDAIMAGAVTIATGGAWSGGAGSYSPNANDLAAIYTPTAAELTAGSVTLTLTTTGNGTCLAETDDIVLDFTPAPNVTAGLDQSVCDNLPDANLNGSVNIATGGIWSGGAGTFTPDASTLNATYAPTPAELAAGNVTLTLTSTGNGNCLAEQNDMTITYTAAPVVDAGTGATFCENNADINLAGTFSNAGGVEWSGGLGVFTPDNENPNAVYTPAGSELTAGTITLTLTTTGNGGCLASSSDVIYDFSTAPTSDAGVDQTVCATQDTIQLGGSFTISTGAIWSGGLGTFDPSNTDPNAKYIPVQSEKDNGSVKLKLTTTGNGNCLAVEDEVEIIFQDQPFINAGSDETSCANNPVVELNGFVGNAGGGIWSGGTGNFFPSNTELNPTYTPSPAEISAGIANITYTTTGNGVCAAEVDNMVIDIVDAPVVDAGIDISVCANNADITLTGLVTNASGGTWSNGFGTYAPSATLLNTVYTPVQAEIDAGFMTLTLTSTGNGSCIAEEDQVNVFFTDAPTANAGVDISVCDNNTSVDLTGVVTIASDGYWSGGLGTFTPGDSLLVTTYDPTPAEISGGSFELVLTTFNNGNCLAVTDTVEVSVATAATVNAGDDLTVCVSENTTDLAGSVAGITNTGSWATLGSGTFSPDASNLNAQYNISVADSLAGSITLVLTSTNNGVCSAVTDTLAIDILPAGVADAGTDVSVCANNAAVNLSGIISGNATTGFWTTAGTGVFIPDENDLNATYVPSEGDIVNGNIEITLTANSCDLAQDLIEVTITDGPEVDAGSSLVICSDQTSVDITGIVSGASTTGEWSTNGSGSFTLTPDNLINTYEIDSLDIVNEEVQIILSSTNTPGCVTVTDTIFVDIFQEAIVDAGADTSLCANNSEIVLTGIITNGGGPKWTTSGTGLFSPSNDVLNATYIPSEGDLSAGFVSLALASEESCNNASDVINIDLTPAPVVNAGDNFVLCSSNVDLSLAGLVSGVTTEGIWTTEGNGTFDDDSDLNTMYHVSPEEFSDGGVTLYLTSVNNANCLAVLDSIEVIYTSGIISNAGSDQQVCDGSESTTLNGLISNGSTTGQWTTSGTGSFSDDTDLSAIYTFSAADSIAGNITLYLTSTNNGDCDVGVDSLDIEFGASPTVSAGDDIEICGLDTTVFLNGFVSGDNPSANWTTSGTGSFENEITANTTYYLSETDIVNGYIELTLSSEATAFCDAAEDMVVINVEQAPVVFAGDDIVTCQLDTIGLSALVAYADGVVWTTSASGTIESDSLLTASYIPTIADSLSGFVDLFATSFGTNYCTASTDTVRILFGGGEIPDAGVDQAICADGTNVLLSGTISGGGAFIWSTLGTGSFSPSDTDINVEYIPSATDLLIGEVDIILETISGLGCPGGQDTIHVDFEPVPVIIPSDDVTVCGVVDSVIVSSITANVDSLQWLAFGTGAIVGGSNGDEIIYVPSENDITAGEVMIVLEAYSDLGCIAPSDTLNIIFQTDIEADFAYENTCVGQVAEFTDQSVVMGGNVIGWLWDFGDGLINQNQNPTHLYDTAGTYLVSFTVFNTSGCEGIMTDSITVNPAPESEFLIDEGGSINDPIATVDLSTDAIAWSWDFGDGSTAVEEQSPTHIYTEPGEFLVTLEVTNDFGCTDVSEFLVKIGDDYIFPPKLPNAFSPNGDNNNDIFLVRGGPFLQVDFKVYNGWGQEIFHSTNEMDGWDGTHNDKEEPVGVYVYTVNAITIDGRAYTKSGKVTLIR